MVHERTVRHYRKKLSQIDTRIKSVEQRRKDLEDMRFVETAEFIYTRKIEQCSKRIEMLEQQRRDVFEAATSACVPRDKLRE